MTKEERQLLQNMTDSTHEQFINAVIVARSNRNDKYKVKKQILDAKILREHADGRIFNGEQALQIGLVDSIGTLADAHDAVSDMAKEKFGIKSKNSIPLVNYNAPTGFNEIFCGAKSQLGKFGITGDISEKLMPFSAKHPNQPLIIWE